MDNRITLTIKSILNEVKDQFDTGQPLRALKEEAMGRLHIDSSQATSYDLYNSGKLDESGRMQKLDEGKTLQELEIPDDLNIVTAIGLGYPNPDNIINTYRSPRRPVQEVVRYKS